MILIKELNKYHYKDFLVLMNQFRKTYFTENDFLQTLENLKKLNNFIYVYELDNKIIGSIKLIIETKFIFNISNVAHIEDLIVDEKYRNLGIGKKLINKCIEKSKEYNCYKIICVCLEDTKEFYIKCGLEYRGCFMSKLLNYLNS